MFLSLFLEKTLLIVKIVINKIILKQSLQFISQSILALHRLTEINTIWYSKKM